MFQRISNKLIITLLTLLLLMSAGFIGFAIWSTPLFLQELNQKLNLNIADNILKEKKLLVDHKVNDDAMKSVFMGLMLVNPLIEVYLLDPNGKILSYAAPMRVVKRKAVDVAPIKQFLASKKQLPVLGNDPREFGRNKVFSAAAIYQGKVLQGYLYVVLGGQAYDSAVDLIESSYMMRLWVGAIGTSLLIVSVAGFLIFRVITRRLRFLAEGMEQFKRDDFKRSVNIPRRDDGLPGDEIDKLAATFSEMSERIIQQVRQLEQNDTQRRELIANVSHDLRTPLASLQGYLETLTLKHDDLDQVERKQYLNIAWQHSQRLRKLIDELFELSRLESGNTQLRLEPVSMSELIQDVTQKFQLSAKRKQLTLLTHIPAEAAFVSADIGLMQRVLENLIDNAIKYTPQGGKVYIELAKNKKGVAIRISDTGYGIPQKDLPYIFDRFYRVDKHRNADGTGLGLAIANRIIKLHNSTIHVDSHPKTGTTFSFQLTGMKLQQRSPATV